MRLRCFVSLLLLPACVPFQAKELKPVQTAINYSARQLTDPGLRAFLAKQGSASGSWSADRLGLVAAYFHPDIALAQAEADEAAAGIKTAQQRPNPVFTFTPQWTSSSVAFTPWFLSPNLDLPIETAGKRQKRTEQALLTAEAARWRSTARAWNARSRVRAAMAELRGARANITLLTAEEKLHDEAIQKLTAQLEAGDVSPFELTQARLLLNRTRLSQQDAHRLAATAEARLAAAVGVSLAVMRGVTLDFASFDRLPDPGNAQRRALSSRADLMALLSEYAAAEAALKLEVAKQYPDLNWRPGYDYNSGQNRWQLGLSVVLPVNRNRGPIAQAEARRTTAEKRFLAQQAAIQAELDIALAAYQASRKKVEVASQLAKEALDAAAKTQQMISAGALSPLELTRRQIEASAAKVALLTAEQEAHVAAGALEDAMQSPLK